MRLYTVSLSGLGCACFLGYQLPFILRLSHHVLPLAYLYWFGLAFLLGGAFCLARWKFNFGPYAFVQHGEPFKARLLDLQKVPTMEQNGQVVRSAVAVLVEAENGEQFWVQSPDFVSDSYTTPLRLGQVVTLVEHAGETVVYGFLGLNSDLEYLQKRSAHGPLVTYLSLLATVLFFGGLMASLYAQNFYSFFPGAGPNMLTVVALGAVVGLPLAALIIAYEFYNAQQRRLRNEKAKDEGGMMETEETGLFTRGGFGNRLLAVLVVLGLWLLGVCFVSSAQMYLNAHWDTSPLQQVEVEFVRLEQTTHSFIYRDYEVKYRDPETGKTHTRNLRHEELPRANVTGMSLRVRQGYLGWPWIEGVEFRTRSDA